MSATSTRSTDDGRSFLNRVTWSLLSQGLSSITNFGLLVTLAVSVSVDEMGRVVSIYSVYLLALTLSRSLTTDALVAAADGSKVIDLPWHWARNRIFALAVAASAIVVLIGSWLDVSGGPVLLLAVVMPFLLLQDGLRNLAWAIGLPDLAGLLDVVWLGVSALAAVMAVTTSGLDNAGVILSTWAAGGVVSWFVGRQRIEGPYAVGQTAGFRPDLLRYRPMAHSQAIMAVAVNLGPVLVALVVSPAMAAVAKAALLPVTPILSLFGGLRVVTLPALRRAIDGGRAAGFTVMLVGVSSLVAAIGGFISIQLVRSLPTDRLGESIAQVVPYLGWVGLICIMYIAGQQLADATALSGRHAVVGRRMVAVGAEWGLLVCGAALAGTKGLMVGWTVGLALATIAWLLPALQS